jgi:hypothetical protein
MPRDAVAIHQINEIPLCVTGQRGFGEVGIRAYKIGVCRACVGEITAPATRNADFFTRGFGVIHDQNITARVGCAMKASGACAKDKCIHMHEPRGALNWRVVQEARCRVSFHWNHTKITAMLKSRPGKRAV